MTHSDPKEAAAPFAPPERWRWWSLRSPSYRRLADTLPPYRHQLEQLIVQVSPAGTPQPSWATSARSLLDRAEEALRAGRAELGWRYLFEAQRLELQGVARLGERALRARATALALEADSKLRAWRKTTSPAMLEKPDALTTAPADVYVVAQVHLLLTEAYTNTYLKISALRNQMALLILAVVMALLLWFVLEDPRALGDLTMPRDVAASGEAPLASVLLFGVMGAGISGILALARLSPSLKIPEQITHWYVTIARLAVGGVAALVVYLAIHAGVVEVVGGSPGTALVVAFASGFSERLLTSAVEKVGG